MSAQPSSHNISVADVKQAGSTSINPRVVARKRRLRTPEAYVEGILAGDRVRLSEAITLIESLNPAHQELAQSVLQRCLSHTGASYRIGITGVPGVGKSTLIDVLGQHILDQGHNVCVLAVDPSSERTRGSILGDKTRMPHLATHPNAFIRPSPTQGALGGLANRTRETMLLCEAAGFDVVLVETVGVGQSETAVHQLVDCFLLLTLAGAGDTLQGIKRGIMEMANLIAITKADGDNVTAAKRSRGHLRMALSLFPPAPSAWRPEVLTCSSFDGESIAALWEKLETYKTHIDHTGYTQTLRAAQQAHWFESTLLQALHEHILHDTTLSAIWEAQRASVEEGTSTALQAASLVLAQLGKGDVK